MLDTMKYAVVDVESAELAFQVLDSVVIDVAVASLRLCDPDGSDLAGELKARQQGCCGEWRHSIFPVSGKSAAATPGIRDFSA